MRPRKSPRLRLSETLSRKPNRTRFYGCRGWWHCCLHCAACRSVSLRWLSCAASSVPRRAASCVGRNDATVQCRWSVTPYDRLTRAKWPVRHVKYETWECHAYGNDWMLIALMVNANSTSVIVLHFHHVVEDLALKESNDTDQSISLIMITLQADKLRWIVANAWSYELLTVCLQLEGTILCTFHRYPNASTIFLCI